MKYLGYRIDAEGVHPVEEKVKAISRGPKSEERHRAEIVSGSPFLLWKILAAFTVSVGTAVQAAISQYLMALYIQGESLIHQIEGTAHIFTSSGTLLSRARTRTSV